VIINVIATKNPISSNSFQKDLGLQMIGGVFSNRMKSEIENIFFQKLARLNIGL